MSTIFQQYDSSKTDFINPEDFTKRLSGFPEVCISTYSNDIIERFVKESPVKKITSLYSANGILPVYEIHYAGKEIGLFLSRVGAPACAAGLEEIIALGAGKIVLFGCCGVLDQTAVQNNIIIPNSAVRDEGTSYHYIPASEEILANRNTLDILEHCSKKLGIPYITGKTWSTDAIYRETAGMLEKRKKQGCLAVEMECSAAWSVGQFRNIPIAQFFYGADNLDAEKWEPGDLTDYGLANYNKYMALALECAISL